MIGLRVMTKSVVGILIPLTLVISATLIPITFIGVSVASATTTIPTPGAGWDFNGSAAESGGTITLTPAEEGEAGTAWYETPITLSSPLTVSFDLTMSGGSGADGVFVGLLNSDDDGPTAVGTGGGGIGFGGLSGIGASFDTFNDSCGDPSSNFVAISDGSTCSGNLDYDLGSTSAIPTLHGYNNAVTITFNPGDSPSIDVTMNGSEVFEHSVSSIPSSSYFGFASSTGLYTDEHVISNFQMGAVPGVRHGNPWANSKEPGTGSAGWIQHRVRSGGFAGRIRG